jgi:predicted transcriptional regulator
VISMEREPELSGTDAPATKADVLNVMRFVMAEVRHLRTCVEGKLEALDQRFMALEERFTTINERFTTINERFNTVDEKIERSAERVIATMTRRLLLADLAVVAAILGVQGA